jgi:hypothetical protein
MFHNFYRSFHLPLSLMYPPIISHPKTPREIFFHFLGFLSRGTIIKPKRNKECRRRCLPQPDSVWIIIPPTIHPSVSIRSMDASCLCFPLPAELNSISLARAHFSARGPRVQSPSECPCVHYPASNSAKIRRPPGVLDEAERIIAAYGQIGWRVIAGLCPNQNGWSVTTRNHSDYLDFGCRRSVLRKPNRFSESQNPTFVTNTVS